MRQTSSFRLELAWNYGHHNNGFYEDACEGPRLNSTVNRGRIYQDLDYFPTWLKDLCLSHVCDACGCDPRMPAMIPTHLLLLYYKASSGIGWHRDDSENDGIGEEPVVSFSIGDSCDFAVRHEPSDEARVLRLDSGDVLLFGGPCRRILHTVTAVHCDTGPSGLPAKGRFNFTFRSAPNILGREREFEYFKPAIHARRDGRSLQPSPSTRASMTRAAGPPAQPRPEHPMAMSRASEPRSHAEGAPPKPRRWQRQRR